MWRRLSGESPIEGCSVKDTRDSRCQNLAFLLCRIVLVSKHSVVTYKRCGCDLQESYTLTPEIFRFPSQYFPGIIPQYRMDVIQDSTVKYDIAIEREITRQQNLFLNINQLDALNFIISLFQASTCFEHMCSSSGGQNCIIQSLVSSY